MQIYVAGKNVPRAQAVMDALRKEGHVITYDWIATLSQGPVPEVALAEAAAVRRSELLVYLWEADQESARYETGMMMGLERPIIVSGYDGAFFFQLPMISCVPSDDDILSKIRELAV